MQPFIAKIQQPEGEGQEPQDMIGIAIFYLTHKKNDFDKNKIVKDLNL